MDTSSIRPDFLKMPRAIHPGAILRNDLLPALGLNVAAAAEKTGLPVQTLLDLTNEQQSINLPIAIALARIQAGTAEAWMQLQNAYDRWNEVRRLRD